MEHTPPVQAGGDDAEGLLALVDGADDELDFCYDSLLFLR
jgi:hypothetical protein